MSNKTASGEPVKDFFIEMLTKDIELKHAILDLVDNSVDAARRSDVLQGKRVTITFSERQFKIDDNCGGMTLEDAEARAFRLGRDPRVDLPKHALGLYGVGMKRAIFKMGGSFEVESKAEKSHFIVAISTQAWRNQVGDHQWDFPFKLYDAKFSPGARDVLGTKITVTNLNEPTKTEFRKNTFKNDLVKLIGRVHQESVRKGLQINVGKSRVAAQEPMLLVGQGLLPIHVGKAIGDVQLRLYAGIVKGEYPQDSPRDAGWYLFCNDRLILDADQTGVSGWGERDIERVPKFHNQFARFRGYVYLDSANGRQLPWDTTKSGLDENAPLYVASIRPLMVLYTRQIVDFLNALDKEQESTSRPLKRLVDACSAKPLSNLAANTKFAFPQVEKQTKEFTKITYTRPTQEVEEAMAKLNVQKPSEVGEATFDYYYELNCE